MAKINTYDTVTPAAGDKLLGTDVSDTSNDINGETANFLIGTSGAVIPLLNGDNTHSGSWTVTGAFTSVGIQDNSTGSVGFRVGDTKLTIGIAGSSYGFNHIDDDQFLRISGGSAQNQGTNFLIWGQNHANAGDFDLRNGSTSNLYFDESNNDWDFKDAAVATTGKLTGDVVVVGSYTVGTVPTASSYTGGMIHVSNESGGAQNAYSDGTNWKRMSDGATVS